VARCLRPAPVLEKHDRVGPLHGDLPDLAGLENFSAAADHRNRVTGHWLAHRAGLERADLRARADHQVALGLPVELINGEIESFAAPFQRLDAERLAA